MQLLRLSRRTWLGMGLLLATSPAWAADAEPAKPLRIGKLRVGKILFLGNSITLHAPAPNIGWTGNWGMAASAADKDYVHLLVERIAKQAGGRPEIMVRNIADFERGLGQFKIRETLQRELEFQADLIIVAIGENSAAPAGEEKQREFLDAYRGLLTELRHPGQPTILVRSQFWPDETKDRLIRQASEAAGTIFLDIGRLGRDESNFARSERKIEHAGVAGHPGDKGMREIATALWDALRKEGDAPSK